MVRNVSGGFAGNGLTEDMAHLLMCKQLFGNSRDNSAKSSLHFFSKLLFVLKAIGPFRYSKKKKFTDLQIIYGVYRR